MLIHILIHFQWVKCLCIPTTFASKPVNEVAVGVSVEGCKYASECVCAREVRKVCE